METRLGSDFPPRPLRDEHSPDVRVNQAVVTRSLVLTDGNSGRRIYGLRASMRHQAGGGIVLGRLPSPPVPTAWAFVSQTTCSDAI